MSQDICRECGGSNLPCNACGGGPVFQSQARVSFAIAGEIQSPEPLGPEVKGGEFVSVKPVMYGEPSTRSVEVTVVPASKGELPAVPNLSYRRSYDCEFHGSPHGDVEIVPSGDNTFCTSAQASGVLKSVPDIRSRQVLYTGTPESMGWPKGYGFESTEVALDSISTMLDTDQGDARSLVAASQGNAELVERALALGMDIETVKTSTSDMLDMIETAKRSLDNLQWDKALDAFAKLAPTDSGIDDEVSVHFKRGEMSTGDWASLMGHVWDVVKLATGRSECAVDGSEIEAMSGEPVADARPDLPPVSAHGEWRKASELSWHLYRQDTLVATVDRYKHECFEVFTRKPGAHWAGPGTSDSLESGKAYAIRTLDGELNEVE